MLHEDDINVTNRDTGVVVGELKGSTKFPYTKTRELVMFADGLDNMLNYIQNYMKEPKDGMHTSSKRRGGADDDFHKFATYKYAMDMFRNTPQKVVEFNPGELRIKDKDEAGSIVDYDVVGDYIDMGRYMEGIPESWGSMHAGNARNRRVNIMIDLNQVSSTDQRDITHRSERILRLIDALEANGVRTQLVCMLSNQCVHAEVVLKRHEEPLTISDLAVATHPEFLRRTMFRVIEWSDTRDGGYGRPFEFTSAINAHPELMDSDNNDEMNIFVAGNMQGKDSIDKKFDQLEKLLVWEMGKPIPEVDAVKIDSRGLFFNPNGMRESDEIRREGMEAINEV